MNKRKKQILIIFIVLLILIGLYFLLTQTEELTQNDTTVEGNTAGNLNNGGYFCQNGSIVYFANAYDNNCLYSMNVDETNITKLSKAKVKYINAAGDYIYYYQEDSTSIKDLGFVQRISGVYRSKIDGNDSFCLNKDPSGIVKLVGNYIYYQHYDNENGMTLHKISIDKKEEEEIANYIINPSSYGIGYIFFNGIENDHHLYQLNVNSNLITSIWDGDLWNPTYHDGYIYYMDISSNYKLCRYSLQNKMVEVLTNDRLDFFNIYEDIIYYQKSSTTSPALKRMNLDGTNPEIVDEGNFQNINITSRYVYYNAYDIPVPVYKTVTYGPINIETFGAAADAIPIETD